MRILVCGGRDFVNMRLMRKTLDGLLSDNSIEHVIHGGATGADILAGRWALDSEIEHTVYPAKWGVQGKSAGPIRNAKMLKEGKPDLVVAFPGGAGTANMVMIAKKAGVRVIEVPDG